MQDVGIENRAMYHMSHLKNLRNIILGNGLLSQEELERKNIITRSIANSEVQALRKRIYIWDLVKKQYRALHSYVPFYFTTDTPMFRNQHSIKGDIIFFEVNIGYISTIDHSVLFTDGNASNQQLSKYFGEKVYITPVTSVSPTCIRKYTMNGPRGKNVYRSNFYADEVFLDRVRWDVIDGHHVFIESREEYLRVKHAEALVPDRFPLDEMTCICVRTPDTINVVKSVFAQCRLSENDFDPPVICKPSLFFH